jgi:hypothetical protein
MYPGCGNKLRRSGATWEEMAADRALGPLTCAQMLAATERANARLAEIAVGLETAAQENALASLVAAENAAALWAELDPPRCCRPARARAAPLTRPPCRLAGGSRKHARRHSPAPGNPLKGSENFPATTATK